MITNNYVDLAIDLDDQILVKCPCNDGMESLEIDYDANAVWCNICGTRQSNWLIKNLIELYAPDIDDDCKEQIKTYFYIENVEREEAEVNKSIEFLKHAKLS